LKVHKFREIRSEKNVVATVIKLSIEYIE